MVTPCAAMKVSVPVPCWNPLAWKSVGQLTAEAKGIVIATEVADVVRSPRMVLTSSPKPRLRLVESDAQLRVALPPCATTVESEFIAVESDVMLPFIAATLIDAPLAIVLVVERAVESEVIDEVAAVESDATWEVAVLVLAALAAVAELTSATVEVAALTDVFCVERLVETDVI